MNRNKSVEIRPVTHDDICAFFETDSPPFTVKGLSFFLEGELVAIGGVRYERGYFIAFSDIKPGVTVSKATVYRCGLEVMKFIKDLGIPVVAMADENLESAPRFLTHLGFEYKRSDPNGEVFTWQC
jgi:hypothetical protein